MSALTNASASVTKPLLLVRWSLSGAEERLSTGEEVIYEGDVFTAGGIIVESLRNHHSATVKLPFTTDRMAEIQSDSWRATGYAKVYSIPALPDETTFVAADGLLVLDGRIEKPSFSGGSTITVQLVNKSTSEKKTPRFTFDHVTNISSPPGSQIIFDGYNLLLEAPR